jgi:hypothetical protein
MVVHRRSSAVDFFFNCLGTTSGDNVETQSMCSKSSVVQKEFMESLNARLGILVAFAVAVYSLAAQAPREPQRPLGPRDFDGPPPRNFGGPPFDGPPPAGFGGRGPGMMGPPGDMREERKLVAQFDKDGDNRLNAAERKAAREFLAKEKAEGRGPRRFGPRGRNENNTPPEPGPKLSSADVKSFGSETLYASNILRTLFLEFDDMDWEKELADFKGTDVEVPAKLTVDGKAHRDVGVHFRGASS